MSLNSDIRDQAYQFFIEEAQELLQVLETGLLDLREDHSTPKVHELMRAAHSIKGGAASVELNAIELLAHRLEDFFKALYSDGIEFDAELEGLLLQGYDCLRNPLAEQIESGTFDTQAALLNAEPVFAALEIRLEDALKNAESYIPSANDLGVDIVHSIFEVDVTQSLNDLQTIANNPDAYDIKAQLHVQLEVFAGFGELFNLPGFNEIISTAQTALQYNSDEAEPLLRNRALEILQALIADCTLATAQILSGDRNFGGEVSATLKALAQSTSEVSEDKAIAHFEQDNIWDTVSPSPQDLAADVFGAIPVSSNELDNVFGAIPVSSNELDNVFGAIPTPGNELDDVFGAIPTPGNELDDVFGAIPTPGNESEVNELDNVFGAIPTPGNESEVNELDDVFGAIPDGLETSPPTIQPEQIETVIETITEIFDTLPSVESVPESLTLSPKKAQVKSKTVAKAPTQAATKLSVKVDLERLERMNNLVGELTINRNSLALQNQQLQLNVAELGQKFLNFRELTQKLRDISDIMLLEQRSQSLRNPLTEVNTASYQSSTTPLLLDGATEFDALEMDSYSSLYASLQEILEEIVQLEESVDDITIFAKQSDRTISNQRQMLNQVRDELMWVRMLPLDQILQRFPRTLRDLSSKYQKPVELKLTGTGVLVDKAVLEKLSDPLLHLLRNGFDHGIESPEVREKQGKSPQGLIEIHAYYQGNQTVIEVKDDGKGLDLNKIKDKAIERGLISPTAAATASIEALYELIFEPGFSTASKVSEISGRGVGMNIVRSQIESLKGKITVSSIPGEGSTFTLRLPLTLTISKLLVCSLGSTAFAIPSDSIIEILIPTVEQIKFANQQKFLSWNNKLIAVYPLQEILQYNCPVAETDSYNKAFKSITPPKEWLAPLLLLRRGQEFFALEVVSLLSEQELVIKPYGKAIAPPAYSYGCTILSDGSLIPVLEGAALINSILGQEVSYQAGVSKLTPSISDMETVTNVQDGLIGQVTNSNINSNKITLVKTIMVVDDSTALRRTMALTLEKQGYRVLQKKDGKDALDGFGQNPAIDLIICDIEMPTMNGFEFLGMRRRDPALAKIPTFMLTSRSGAKHRNLAMQLGANGYFTKPYIEQEFVAEVKKVLADSK
ncbi:CheA signal transduction histidine kinase [Chondrocystis sp. NIES-4102]|nr:CheA signal transduction histidine kinase [Chondrocystis sp. NIES-4102]